MRDATIIVFKNKKGTPNRELKKFCNKLYGYTDQSNKSNYTYHRRGLLGEIPHIHLEKVRNVLVTSSEDAPRVIELLEEFGADIFSRKVVLEKDDWTRFTLKLDGRDETTQVGQDAEADAEAQAQEAQ